MQILIYYVGIPKSYVKGSKTRKNRNLIIFGVLNVPKAYNIMTSLKLSKLLLDLTKRSLDEFSQFFCNSSEKTEASFSKLCGYAENERKGAKKSKTCKFWHVT